MRVLTVRLRNFGSHADTMIEFPDGCVSLTGPNGAGKSTILAAVDVALFGADGRSLAPLVRRGGDGTLHVELEFEHGGERYRVRRQVTKSKTTVDLERLEEHEAFVAGNGDREDDAVPAIAWMSLTRETAKETQVAIDELLGFSRRTLRASSLLMQSDAGAFCNADPRDRKQILAEVLGLDRYTVLADAVRADRAQADADAQRLDGRIEALSDGDPDELARRVDAALVAVADAKVRGATLATTVAQCERDADSFARDLQAHRDRSAARRELEANHRAATERAEALRRVDVEAQTARERADGVRTRIAALERLADEHDRLVAERELLLIKQRARLDAVREQERLLAEHGRLVEAEDRHDRALAEIDLKIERIESDPGAICDRCEQHLPDQARAAALTSLRCERDAVAGALADAREQEAAARSAANALVIPEQPAGLDALTERITETASAVTDLAANRAWLASLEETIARTDSDDHRAALAQAEASERELAERVNDTPEDDPALEAQAQERALTAQATAAAARDEYTRVREQIPALEQRLTLLAETAETLAQLRVEAVELAQRRALLQLLERAYGPNGIPMLILENAAIPAIEAEANAVLARLAGKPAAEGWRVELRTQAETKAGALRDALDVIVHVPDGQADYATLSGSEKVKVAIALRLGVARLLANRRGADCQLLALDEPEGLDDEGKAALIDLVAGLAGRYATVILASHDPDLRDRFDHSIHVGGTVEREPDEVLA